MNGVTTMSIKLTAPRKNLVAATAVSAILAALACLSTASAQTAQSGTTAQNAKGDMARCSQLFSTRSKYHANGSEPTAQDVQAEMALQDCRAGRYDTGIAALEGMLKQKGIPVPPSETASAPR
jgi:hypothetical protein